MYTALLTVHSYLRWLVLLVALVALFRAVAGVTQRRPWTSADDAAAKWFGMSLDLQMVIGLIIYVFLSPFTMSAWSDIGAAMRDDTVRFVVIEHQFGMIVAVALAHIGRSRIRKIADPARRHRLALIFFGIAFVVMVASIPWPGRPGGRELFRGLGV
jgi:putative copper export protein